MHIKLLLFIISFCLIELSYSQSTEVKNSGHDYRLSVSGMGGFARRIGKTPDNIDPQLQDHINSTKSSYFLKGEVNYFISPEVGIGVKYSQFFINKSTKVQNLQINESTSFTGTIREKINISFLGPHIGGYKYYSKDKLFLYYSIGIGYMTYKNEGDFRDEYSIKGNTYGFNFQLGLDVISSENVALCLSAEYTVGRVGTLHRSSNGVTTKIVIDDPKNRESLNRFEIGIGLKIFKSKEY